MNYQLAQVNIAQARATMEAPEMADFVTRISEINSLAENAPGYVWRYTGPADATALAPLVHYLEDFDPDRLLFNMSVWTDLDSLRAYLYRSDHAELIRNRKRWFAELRKPSVALWWVHEGVLPTIAEAVDRLVKLEREGSTGSAFSLKDPFPPTSD